MWELLRLLGVIYSKKKLNIQMDNDKN
jgi:hypothetical protein